MTVGNRSCAALQGGGIVAAATDRASVGTGSGRSSDGSRGAAEVAAGDTHVHLLPNQGVQVGFDVGV